MQHRVRVSVGSLLMVAAFLTQAQSITVSAASSLLPAVRDVSAAFEAAHPGTKVHLNVAASGVLVAQLAQGAPVDVLATADEHSLAAARPWLAFNTAALFARTTLVLATPRAQPARLKKLADLKVVGIHHIAMGSPQTVPAGRYAQTALLQAGLWKDLQARFVFTQSANQTLQYLRRAQVDAAFMYKTDALQHPDLIRIDLEIPTRPSVMYAMAITAATSQPEWARRFTAFVQTAAAQAIWAQHGFDQP